VTSKAELKRLERELDAIAERQAAMSLQAERTTVFEKQRKLAFLAHSYLEGRFPLNMMSEKQQSLFRSLIPTMQQIILVMGNRGLRQGATYQQRVDALKTGDYRSFEEIESPLMIPEELPEIDRLESEQTVVLSELQKLERAEATGLLSTSEINHISQQIKARLESIEIQMQTLRKEEEERVRQAQSADLAKERSAWRERYGLSGDVVEMEGAKA